MDKEHHLKSTFGSFEKLPVWEVVARHSEPFRQYEIVEKTGIAQAQVNREINRLLGMEVLEQVEESPPQYVRADTPWWKGVVAFSRAYKQMYKD